LTLAPQVSVYRYITGHWIVSPYSLVAGAGFRFGSPHLWGVLFGVQKGLFFWSPMLLFAALGVGVATGWAARFRWATIAIFAINAYLIASWSDWQFGASYGHRAFTDGLPLAAVFLAAAYQWVAARPRWMAVASVAGSCGVALSIAQMIQYWLHILPVANTTWAEYRALFLRFQ
jgi:hypothetical protein